MNQSCLIVGVVRALFRKVYILQISVLHTRELREHIEEELAVFFKIGRYLYFFTQIFLEYLGVLLLNSFVFSYVLKQSGVSL